MWQMTRLVRNGFEDQQSGPFKTTKETIFRKIQRWRNVFRSIAFQLERTSWIVLRAGNLLGTNEGSCCNGAEVQKSEREKVRVKCKHSNPPDLSNNLLLSRFHKYSPDIENFHHKKLFFLPNCREWSENTFFTLEVYHLCIHIATSFC